MNWKTFLQNPETHIQECTGRMMIILQKDIRPQPVFALLVSGANFDPRDFGYMVIDDKIPREGRHYLSPEMYSIKQWCNQYNLQYSFNYSQDETSPFLEDNCMQIVGTFTKEMINSFPVPTQHIYIVEDTHDHNS